MRAFPARALLVISLFVALAGQPGTARAQAGNGITSPRDGEVVSGSVQIVGTATLPDFLRYELYFSSNEQDWVYFAGGNAPVIGGVLGYLDTIGANLPDGRYSLRMRVVRADSNYDEYFVHWLVVANAAPPSPSPSPTPLEQPETPTPLPTGAQPSGTITVTVELPPTRAVATPSPTRSAGERATPSPLIPLPSVSLAGLQGAFCLGSQITLVAFIAIGGYVFLRGGLRWAWRRARRELYRRGRRG